jgi:hypothetical protein
MRALIEIGKVAMFSVAAAWMVLKFFVFSAVMGLAAVVFGVAYPGLHVPVWARSSLQLLADWGFVYFVLGLRLRHLRAFAEHARRIL